MIAYGAEDARRILGRRSAEIDRILGFTGRSVMVHRDDLVLFPAADDGRKDEATA